MNRRRKPLNVLRILGLLVLVVAAVYINNVIVPTIPPPFVPTPTPTRAPESFVSDAQALFDSGKLSQAIDAYQQAVLANPRDATIYLALARAQMFNGMYAEAQENAENALLLNPNNAFAHALRSYALTNQVDFLQAEAAIKEALSLDPNNAIAHAYYAELLANQFLNNTGPFDAIDLAVEESRLAISLSPNALETRRARGFVLYVTGNYEEAVQEYQAAIAINSNVAALHLTLGLVYRDMGVHDLAVESFTRANTLNPADPNPELYTSRTYARVGENAKAVQYAEQAVADVPSDPLLRGNLGVLYYYNQQRLEAIEQLSLMVGGGTTPEGVKIEAVPLTSNSRIVEYYVTYGLALARVGRCVEAVPILQNISIVAPSDELALYNASEGLKACQEILLTPTATP